MADQLSAGPGSAYELFEMSEELVEKLKFLEYEKELFGKVDGVKIVPRHYFVNSTNAGEQFFMFTTLCTWLMRKAQWKDVNLPSELDDPNTVIAMILDAMKSKDLDANYANQKLKSGAGKPCLMLMLSLANAALQANKFEFQRIIPIESEQTHEEQDQQDEAELTAEQHSKTGARFEKKIPCANYARKPFDEEEDVAGAEDNDDVDYAEMNESRTAPDIQDDLFQEPLQQILHNVTEANALRNEIERVLPQLRVTIRASDKHWRMHEKQLAKLQETTRTQFDTVQPFLSQMSSEISQSVERIRSREKHLNEQLDGLLQEHRQARNALAEAREKYREASGGLTSRQETLQRIGDEIDQIKQQIDEQGAQNSNGAPILKITQAIAKIEQSILTMSIQTATIEQSLHQSQLNDRNTSAFYGTMS
ncbi:Intraflagellar transport protein che-13 [Aphelenchoides bicaudatus]|nr:Intraflagellar transport protein che-13 [Aphelenchoides bicaudatus]